MEKPETFWLKLPARFRYLKLITDGIELLLAELPQRAAQETVVYGLKLAVHEVANNIIEHAYQDEEGLLEVTLQFDPTSARFTAHLADTGLRFDAAQSTTPSLDEPQESGYGLFLAQQFMDEVTYTRQADRNHWRLSKQLV
ncbi:MAG: ATP-binding protein [Caldilineaceae bacterium]|nr:ATP-binding protein [Caldilineaceae bacterium]